MHFFTQTLGFGKALAQKTLDTMALVLVNMMDNKQIRGDHMPVVNTGVTSLVIFLAKSLSPEAHSPNDECKCNATEMNLLNILCPVEQSLQMTDVDPSIMELMDTLFLVVGQLDQDKG